MISIGPVTLDPKTRMVTTDRGTVMLTGMERDVLHAIMSAKGETVRIETLIMTLYPNPNNECENSGQVVRVILSKTRRKLRSIGVDEFVKNVWGDGYRVIGEPQHMVAVPAEHLAAVNAFLRRLETGPSSAERSA